MSVHTWCRDIPRDEAVRAAEDGRSGPLPTLEEAISAVTERRPPEPGGGGNVTGGMRTERVTLEVTHGESFGVSHWSWVTILRLQSGESVRVVDEVHFDDLANMSLERDAAIRERDQGKEFWMGELRSRTAERDAARARVAELESAPAASGAAGTEPVAWMCEWTDHTSLYDSKTQAEIDSGGETVPQPLYRSPPQAASGWLTAEERGALERAFDLLCDDDGDNPLAGTVQRLLARSSPPEVVLPALPPYAWSNAAGPKCGWDDCMGIVRYALAVAGVKVKEVGK